MIRNCPVIDPVCGMEIKEPSQYISVFKGQHFRFCSAICKKQFDEVPQYYSVQRKPFVPVNRDD